MFTGIVLKTGKLLSLDRKREITLTVETGRLEDVKIGDSVAVNGACLTVVEFNTARTHCKFNLSQETLKLSNFADLTKGTLVNIELPLRLQDFLGGHLVSGHLDGVVRLRGIQKKGDSTTMSFTYQNKDWKKFLVHKGSVTLNGVSLTLSQVKATYFAVEIIPHTLESTNLKYAKIGERINLELDLIGKYLYNLQWPG